MSRTVTLSEKKPPAVSLKKKSLKLEKKEFIHAINEQMFVTLGILSLCILLLGLSTPLWPALSLGILLLFIQLVLYLQTRFFSMKID